MKPPQKPITCFLYTKSYIKPKPSFEKVCEVPFNDKGEMGRVDHSVPDLRGGLTQKISSGDKYDQPLDVTSLTPRNQRRNIVTSSSTRDLILGVKSVPHLLLM